MQIINSFNPNRFPRQDQNTFQFSNNNNLYIPDQQQPLANKLRHQLQLNNPYTSSSTISQSTTYTDLYGPQPVSTVLTDRL